MKKIIALAASVFALAAAPAHAQNSDTATGSATATVITPINVDQVAGAKLNFGSFTFQTAGAGGTVTVDAASGGATPAGLVMMLNSTSSADQFNVTGDGSRTFSIVTQPGEVTHTTTATAKMAFTTAPSASTGTLANGAASFKVGGVLTVPANALPGTYNGNYDVTVAYN